MCVSSIKNTHLPRLSAQTWHACRLASSIRAWASRRGQLNSYWYSSQAILYMATAVKTRLQPCHQRMCPLYPHFIVGHFVRVRTACGNAASPRCRLLPPGLISDGPKSHTPCCRRLGYRTYRYSLAQTLHLWHQSLLSNAVGKVWIRISDLPLDAPR